MVIGNSISNYINISLSFGSYHYCINPIDMIKEIINSKLNSISITAYHDIIPTIIKSHIYYYRLRKKKFIRCSRILRNTLFLNIKHSYKSMNINQNNIDKIVLDILVTSSSDYLYYSK